MTSTRDGGANEAHTKDPPMDDIANGAQQGTIIYYSCFAYSSNEMVKLLWHIPSLEMTLNRPQLRR